MSNVDSIVWLALLLSPHLLKMRTFAGICFFLSFLVTAIPLSGESLERREDDNLSLRVLRRVPSPKMIRVASKSENTLAQSDVLKTLFPRPRDTPGFANSENPTTVLTRKRAHSHVLAGSNQRVSSINKVNQHHKEHRRRHLFLEDLLEGQANQESTLASPPLPPKPENIQPSPTMSSGLQPPATGHAAAVSKEAQGSGAVPDRWGYQHYDWK